MSKQSPPLQPPTFSDLFCETTRILSSNRRHFLNLSLLFLLPQSLFITIYFGLTVLHPKFPTTASIILTVIYGLLSFIVSLLAIGSISFSSYNFLLGRPIKLISSINSLLRSFPRLLFTSLAYLLINFLVLFVLVLLAGVVMKIEIVWLEVDDSSFFFYSTGINIMMYGLIIAQSYMPLFNLMSWTISCVIVVIESKQGFEHLRRSAQLMKENRQALSPLTLDTGVIWLGFMCGFFYLVKQAHGDLKSLLFVLGIAVNTGIGMMSMLVYFVSITVLYCKVAQGEYSSLPLVEDDEKACKDDSHVMPSSSEIEMA